MRLPATTLSLALLATACSSSGSDKSLSPATDVPAKTAQISKQRHFLLTYEATVKSAPEGAKQVDLWLPIAQDSAFQRARLVKVSAPAGQEVNVEPLYNNKIFHVSVAATSLPLVVQLDFDVTRFERKTDVNASTPGATLSPTDRQRYLVGTPLVPVGDKVIEMSGFKSSGNDPLQIGRDAYNHVLAKMKYDKPANSGWGKGSTEWACTQGFGNCTDFHAYFMSLMRTKGIPARFFMGLPLPMDKTEGEIGGYHCWAEFFVEGKGWVPVDISEADKVADTRPDVVEFYFGGLTVDRVEFSAGRDVYMVPRQAGPPLNYFIYPYCEIDGKEAAKDLIGRKFTFKDV